MTPKVILAGAGAAAVVGVAAFFLRQQITVAHSTAQSTSQATPGIRIIEAEPRAPGCDGFTAGSPLPASIQLPTASIDAIVDAIDRTLPDDHIKYLRCSRDETDLMARSHFSQGKWLRTTLHLWAKNDVTAVFRARGITNADDASSVLLRVLFHKLKGEPPAIDDVVARVKAASRP